jgi:predicted transposase YdaD
MKSNESDLSPQPPQSELKKRYQHDEFCKDNLRDINKARKFLKWLLKSEIVELLDLDRLELSSESFLTEDLKKLYADILYRIPV